MALDYTKYVSKLTIKTFVLLLFVLSVFAVIHNANAQSLFLTVDGMSYEIPLQQVADAEAFCSGKTFYVDVVKGSNLNHGMSRTAPFKSYEYAKRRAKPGDEIIVIRW